ncbi:MAG: hypothetical protein ACLFNK_05345, partial [Candidatus Woesearchaeota archaeon]
RFDTFEKEKDNRNMTKYVFENLYESIREISECITLLDGIKIYSHEITIIYLREKGYIDDKKASRFDDIRRLRNKSKYYGKEISPEKLKDSLDNFNDLRVSLENKFQEKRRLE